MKDENRELIDKEVRRAKFRLLGPLGQGYNIIVYIYRSSAYIDHFRKLVGRMILMDNCI